MAPLKVITQQNYQKYIGWSLRPQDNFSISCNLRARAPQVSFKFNLSSGMGKGTIGQKSR